MPGAGLMAIKLPKLHAHLDSIQCEPAVFSTDWWVLHADADADLNTGPTTASSLRRLSRFLCLYCTSLPAESAARVWDALFNEGAKILHRVALALLKQLEPELLRCDNAGVRQSGAG